VSPGFERLVRKVDQSPLEVVDLETGSVVAKLPQTFALQYYFRSPGSLIVLRLGIQKEDGDKAGRLIVHEYDVAANRPTELFDVAYENGSTMTALVNGERELFIGRPKSGRVEVWDLPGRKLAREFTLAGLKPSNRWDQFVVSPDGKWVAVDLGITGIPEIFNGSTGAAVGPSGSARSFPTFVPGRNMLMGRHTVVVNSLKGEIRTGLWAYDIDRRTITAFLPGKGSLTAFSADGRTAVTWELFRKTDIGIWDLTQLP
jgi:hypothetical protein